MLSLKLNIGGFMSLTKKKIKMLHDLMLPQNNKIIVNKLNNFTFDECGQHLLAEFSEPKIPSASLNELFHQILLARFFVLKGATIVPMRIIKKVLLSPKLKENNKNNSKNDVIIIKKILYTIAVIFFDLGYLKEVQRMNLKYTLFSSQKTCEEMYCKFITLQSQCLLSAEYFNNEIEEIYIKIKKDCSELEAFIEFCLHSNKISFKMRATSHTEVDSRKVNEELRNSYIQFFKERYLTDTEYCQETELCLPSASTKGSSIDIKLGFLFFRHSLLKENLSLVSKIALMCFPNNNPYSFFLENRYIQDMYAPIGHVRPVGPQKTHNCWYISNVSLSSIDFKDIQGSENILDLCSGVVIRNGTIDLLGKIRSTALMNIISTGSLGTNDFLIAERIFYEDKIFPECAVSRVQDIVTQLINQGYPIFRKNKKIYFNFEKNNLDIIIPKNHIYLGELYLLNKLTSYVNVKTIMEKLGLSKRSASLYIKSWKDVGAITASKLKYGDFQIEETYFNLIVEQNYKARSGQY